MTDWATSRDLHLNLTGSGLRSGLMDALREAVRSERLAPGTRLPSSRSLAADLGIARNTVVDAYAELIAEGWLAARQGSGTTVAARAKPRTTPADPSSATRIPHRPTYGLLPGSPNLAEFPRAQWLAANRRAVTNAPHDALGYGDPAGRIELRTALADYLARARGVYAEPERIIICAGFHQGLTLAAQALKARRAGAVAVESYGFDVYRRLLANAGLRTESVRVDEHGARTHDLAAMSRIGAVLLTPAHQYPTGVELAPERRSAAVDWARATDGLILEDDYDGEYRYDRGPVGALQGLDPERVVYFGSASKALAPGLRIAWMVAPESFVPEVLSAKGNVDWTSTIEQLTLAEFITSGNYDRHVRSTRLHYRRRRDEMVEALARRALQVHVSGLAAGLQALIELPHGTERRVVEAAALRGLAVSGLADYTFEPKVSPPTQRRDALVVGYAAPTESAWAGTLETLCVTLSTFHYTQE